MRNKLISYIDLLFAGNPDTEDIKQEILQNTLDRYDDLIAQGKTPEEAYSQTISGIGDISEIIGRTASQSTTDDRADAGASARAQKKKTISKVLVAVAVALYILCAVPVVVLHNEVGVCLLLAMVAIATALIIIAGTQRRQLYGQLYGIHLTPKQKLRHSIHSAVGTVGLVIYFIISFMTGAWYITWLVFPIVGAINGLVSACMDLKEAE